MINYTIKIKMKHNENNLLKNTEMKKKKLNIQAIN